MRRLVIGAALVGGLLVAARALGPKLHSKMLAKCQAMFEHAPEDFPPKKIMRGVDEIRANQARILEVVEQRAQAHRGEPQDDPTWKTAEEVEVAHAGEEHRLAAR